MGNSNSNSKSKSSSSGAGSGKPAELDANKVAQVFIPPSHVSRIVGKGREKVRGVEEKFGVLVRVPSRDSKSCETRVFSPKGDAKSLEAAIGGLKDLLGYEPSRKPLVEARLAVPAKLVGKLIGPKGATLKEIESTHACALQVPGRDEEGPVVLFAAESSVQAVVQRVSDAVGEAVQLQGSAKPLPTGIDVDQTPLGKVKSEVLFFPSEESPKRFLQLLGSAHNTVDVAVFTLTSNSIFDTLRDLVMSGARVRFITDNSTVDEKGSDVRRLAELGVPIKVDTSDMLMHHKFAILDEQVLLSGSLNWSVGATTGGNAENIVVHNSNDVIQSFQKEFNNMWSDDTRYKDL